MKNNIKRMAVLILSVLLMVGSFAQTAMATDSNEYDTETGYPPLNAIISELDEDEIVKADSVTIQQGDSFDVKDTSEIYKPTKEPTVRVEYYSSHASDGQAFSNNVPGAYATYYVVTPASGHPTYEISRTVTVAAAPTPAPVQVEADDAQPDEDEASGEESEDDPYEDYPEDLDESEDDPGEEYPEDLDESDEDDFLEDDEEDSDESGDDAEEDVTEEDDEILSEDDAEDEEDDEILTDDDDIESEKEFEEPSTEDDIDLIPSDVPVDELLVPEVEISEPAPELEDDQFPPDGNDPDAVDIGQQALPTEEPLLPVLPTEEPLRPVETEQPETEATPVPEGEHLEDAPTLSEETDDTEQSTEEPDVTSEDDGQEEGVEPTTTPDATIEPENTVMPEGTDIPTGVPGPEETEQPVETEATETTEPTEEPIISEEPPMRLLATAAGDDDDDAVEEDDDWEEIPDDNIVLEGSARMVRGKKISYPSSLGSWSTFKYEVNGKLAYCLESKKSAPKAGSFAQEILENNPNLEKAIYYGYGGPCDLSAQFYPSYSANVRYVLTHIAASYFYTGSYSSATNGCSSSGLTKYKVKEYIDFLASQPEPPSPVISLSDRTLEVESIQNGVQTTTSTKLEADSRNVITLSLPDNVTYHNKDTGETQTGGQVTIKGGTTFYFTAPSSVTGKWETGDMPGSIAVIWKVIVVSTGTKTQHLGSYASETYGGDVHFSVKWMNQFTLNIVKADSAKTDVHLAGAVIGIYSDAECTNKLMEVTTDETGSASCKLDRNVSRLYLKELKAPAGYRLTRTVYTVDMPDGDSVSVMIKNEQQFAGLKITKKGEVLTGVDIDDFNVVFKYEVRKLAGATYRVTADSPIYAPDNSLLYQKGDIVADNLTTNENGEVSLNNVPLGTYVIEEIAAPAGYVLATEKQRLTLSYAGQEAEIAFDETTFTNERQKVSVHVIKQDSETKKTLKGAEFAIYAGSEIVSYKGDHLVSAGSMIETAKTDADGNITFKADLPLGYKYIVREVGAPVGYIASKEEFSFAASAAEPTKKTIAYEHTFTNDHITAKINLIKKDAETGTSQGDAQLAGAVYGLYAREPIVYPDGKSGTIHEKDALVGTMTTNAQGEASIEGLYLGKYYVKETTPSVGYNLDDTVYEVDCSKADAGTVQLEVECVVKEQVMKQPAEIIKAANNGKTDADLIEGAGFKAWLVSDLTVRTDGSYDFSSASPVVIGKNGETEIFTDKKGHAVTVALPYGVYIFRETTTPKNFSPVDDFIVTISENHPTTPQVWRVLLDEEFAAKLKVIKVDAATGRTILLAGAEFNICNIDKGEYVTQVTTYPQPTTHSTFKTDESGTLTLPETLQPGHYRVTEISAPEGYLLGNVSADVTISDDSVYRIDTLSGDPVIEVILQDDAAKGRITVYKEGEMLTGYQDGQFIYEVRKLSGATFEVIAAEDIYTSDYQTDAEGNRYIEVNAGTVVAKLTTNEYGEASTDDLPLGTYNIVERQAPNGYVLNGNTYSVTLSYAGQETEVVVESQMVGNERQKVEMIVEKKAEGKDILLPGAEFGLYAGEDITAGGTVIVPAGTYLASAETDVTGTASFNLDLPLGKYLVNELRAPEGYVKSDEVIELNAGYQGQEIEKITVTGMMENAPTRVAISKADATTGVELDGAKLTLSDSEGREIDSWTSVAGEPHIIEGLKIGETYTLKEEIAPYGYLIATTVKFTVGDTDEIQKVVMKDEVPKGTIIINKKGEFLSSVSALDNVGGWIENSFSYITGSLSDVTFAVYAAEDIKHADGATQDYYKAGDLIANITTDNTGIAKLEGLPLGKYVVQEVETAAGYVIDDEERFIDLSYRDSKTAVVTYSEEWQNDRMKVRVKVTKTSEGESTLLEGATFGLFNEDDITSDNGKVLLKAGSLIQQRATDSTGSLIFDADLPTDFSYYIQEIVPPAGYASDPEVQRFFFERLSYIDEVTIFREFTFIDKPTVVEITKSILTTGEELEGAKLQVTDSEGNVVDSWTSEKEPHKITGLVVGKTYQLVETLPADGYVTAETIEFTIEDTGEVQPIEMKDDITKLKISKQDIAGNELEGAKLTLSKENGVVIETWISGKEPHYIEMLPIGKYKLHEETAPDGYLVAEDITFEVKDTGEIQSCVMKDENSPDNPGTPKTGDPLDPKTWGIVGIVAIMGVLTSILIIRKNRRKF